MIFALWSDINWYGFALFLYILMLFDELRWYKWRPLKCRGKWSEYRCSHLISILLFTFRKIVPESLYLQNCWPIAKEIPVHVLSDKSCEKVVFKHFLKFTEKQMCWSVFNKVEGLRPTPLLKRDSSTGVFPWIVRDFLEHLFCTCERLLLVLVRIGLV